MTRVSTNAHLGWDEGRRRLDVQADVRRRELLDSDYWGPSDRLKDTVKAVPGERFTGGPADGKAQRFFFKCHGFAL